MNVDDFTWNGHDYLLGDLESERIGFVYQLQSESRVPLYIGQTRQHIATRWLGHLREKGPLLDAVKHISATEVPVSDLDRVETCAIHHYHPPLNRACPMHGCLLYSKRAFSPRVQDATVSGLHQEHRLEISAALKELLSDPTGDVIARELYDAILEAVPSLKPSQDWHVRHWVNSVVGPSSVVWSPKAGKAVRGWPLAYIQNVTI